jgi:hypothetical protein
MPTPKAPRRARKPGKAASPTAKKAGAAASLDKWPELHDIPPGEITAHDLVRALQRDKKTADENKRATASVTATMAIGRILHLLPDGRGRLPALPKPAGSPAPPAKFDGNYNDAARRIIFLLRLAQEERAEEAQQTEKAEQTDKAEQIDKADGQET